MGAPPSVLGLDQRKSALLGPQSMTSAWSTLPGSSGVINEFNKHLKMIYLQVNYNLIHLKCLNESLQTIFNVINEIWKWFKIKTKYTEI